MFVNVVITKVIFLLVLLLLITNNVVYGVKLLKSTTTTHNNNNRALQTISTILSNDPDLSTFLSLYTSLGGDDTIISSTTPVASIVAPINNAFTNLDQTILTNLNRPDWIAHLRSFVQYHLTDVPIKLTENGGIIIMENDESVTVLVNSESNNQISLLSPYSTNTTPVNVIQSITNSDSTIEIYKTDGVLEPSFFNVGLFSLGDIYSGFSILYELVSAIGLSSGILAGIALEVTIFAPTDEAFIALGEERLNYLRDPANRGEVQTILTNHVLFGLQPTDLLLDGGFLTSFGGLGLQVERSGDVIRVNGATIVQPDVLAKDGIVQGIDRVFLPLDESTIAPTMSPLLLSQAPILPTTTQTPNTLPTPTIQPVTTSTSSPGQGGNGDLDTLLNDVDLIGLDLTSVTPYTLFAPNNNAFAALDSNLLARLRSPSWIAHYRNLLLFHVSIDPFAFMNLSVGQVLNMENGETVQVNMDDTGNMFLSSEFSEKSTIIEGDAIIYEDGSYTHTIDSVLLPSFTGTDLFALRDRYDGFDILFNFIDSFGLGDITQFGAYWTIFAPTDEAFLALGNTTLEEWKDPLNRDKLIEILTSHVFAQVYPSDSLIDGAKLISLSGLEINISSIGGELKANDATITRPDILASNGVVHAIDKVLFDETSTAVDNVYDILQNETDLSIFAAATTTGGIVRLFEQHSNIFTVFAPVDSAFDFFDQDLWSKLQTRAWRLHLRNLLFNHIIIGGFVTDEDLQDGTELIMRNNQKVNVTRFGVDIELTGLQNSANVTSTNLISSLGVVHKIDAILLPPFYESYIIDLLNIWPDFTIITDLIDRAGLRSDINADDGTLLAPIDSAFLALGSSMIGYLSDPDNVQELQELLLSHVFSSVYPRLLLNDGDTLISLMGSSVNVTKTDEDIFLNDATIVRPDVIARNGILHGSDVVLEALPPDTFEMQLNNNVGLSTFTTAYLGAGLNGTVSNTGSFTVLVPTNEAFASIDSYVTKLLSPKWIVHLRNLLDNHATETSYYFSKGFTAGTEIIMRSQEIVQVNVDSNGTLFSTVSTGSSRLVEADIIVFNGVIHTIDTVLLPQFYSRGMGEALGAYSIFADLIARSGLEDRLSINDVTVLVPTDEALTSLGIETIESLKEDPVGLEEFLLSYILDDVYPSLSLEEGSVYSTLGGDFIMVSIAADGSVMFENAAVISKDILFSNGIAHSINRAITSTMASDVSSSIPSDAPSDTSYSDVPSDFPSDFSSDFPSAGVTQTPVLPFLDEIISTENDLTTLFASLEASGFDFLPINVNQTMFAPTDTAFEAVDQDLLAKLLTPNWIMHLQNLLNYHITEPTQDRILSSDFVDNTFLTMLNEETVTVIVTNDNSLNDTVKIISVITPGNPEGAEVVEADLEAFNGVAHKIDEVLLPSFLTLDLQTIQDHSIAEDFSVLFEALNNLGGSAAIPPGDYTILAPTDAAFEKEGQDFIDKFKSDQEFSLPILLDHVFDVVYPSVNLKDGDTITARGGATFTLTFPDTNTIKINDATVVEADFLLRVGIIHAIDTVLNVPASLLSPTISPIATGAPVQTSTTAITNDRSTSASSSLPSLMGYIAFSSFVTALLSIGSMK